MLSSSSRRLLLTLARQGLKDYFAKGRLILPDWKSLPEEIHREAGVFVTLRQHGKLRGCVGTIESCTTLAHEVIYTAVSSATQDHRFPPLAPDELGTVDLEISILTPFQRVQSIQEIVPKRHGVLVKKGKQRGLYLPQVWVESGWDRDTFLRELCRTKAGLPPDAVHDPQTEWYIFEVESFSETSA
ncbi:MAG: AmmeMemoRadiSam system protein A [Elusimicrobiota bacterium]|jgi:hypothetical protein